MAEAPKQVRCSFCQSEFDEGFELTPPRSAARRRRVSTGSFCSTYCRDCVLALAALHPSPLAPGDFISKRALLIDRLLDLWRQGSGPDPALVLQAAETASRGLVIAERRPTDGHSALVRDAPRHAPAQNGPKAVHGGIRRQTAQLRRKT